MTFKRFASILFLVHLISHPLFAGDAPPSHPNIELEPFVNRVVQRLIEVSDSEVEEVVELCEILALINGSYVKGEVGRNLSRFGSKEYYIKTVLLLALHAHREPSFDLEKLMSDAVFGPRLKPLLEEPGDPSFRGDDREGRVTELPSFGEQESQPLAGTLIIVFSYILETETPITDLYSQFASSQKLSGERGNALTSLVRKSYQQIFKEVLAIIDNEMPGYKEDKKIRLYVAFGPASPSANKIVKAIIEIPSFRDPSFDLRFEFSKLMDEYKEDPVTITVEFEPNPELAKRVAEAEQLKEAQKKEEERLRAVEEAKKKEEELATRREREKRAHLVLKTSSRWEEQWLALEDLIEAGAPLSSEMTEDLIRIFEKTESREIKFKALSLLSKNNEAFSKIDPVPLSKFLNEVTAEEVIQIIGPDLKIGTNLAMICVKECKVSVKSKLFGRFLEQNPRIEGSDVIAVVREAGLHSMDKYTSWYEYNPYALIICRALDTLRENGRRADVVHLLPLLRATDNDIRKTAEVTIEAMKKRR